MIIYVVLNKTDPAENDRPNSAIQQKAKDPRSFRNRANPALLHISIIYIRCVPDEVFLIRLNAYESQIARGSWLGTTYLPASRRSIDVDYDDVFYSKDSLHMFCRIGDRRTTTDKLHMSIAYRCTDPSQSDEVRTSVYCENSQSFRQALPSHHETNMTTEQSRVAVKLINDYKLKLCKSPSQQLLTLVKARTQPTFRFRKNLLHFSS